MREIGFRARHLKTGRWWYGTNEITYSSRLDIYALPEFWGFLRKGLLDSSTLGEYIGLKDQQGKGMYEGDIIKYRQETGKVTFEKGAFIVERIGNWDSWAYIDSYSEYFIESEVIGNVFENPELLENPSANATTNKTRVRGASRTT